MVANTIATTVSRSRRWVGVAARRTSRNSRAATRSGRCGIRQSFPESRTSARTADECLRILNASGRQTVQDRLPRSSRSSDSYPSKAGNRKPNVGTRECRLDRNSTAQSLLGVGQGGSERSPLSPLTGYTQPRPFTESRESLDRGDVHRPVHVCQRPIVVTARVGDGHG
jgi:hypothetical protein